jgi:hypothetical protein
MARWKWKVLRIPTSRRTWDASDARDVEMTRTAKMEANALHSRVRVATIRARPAASSVTMIRPIVASYKSCRRSRTATQVSIKNPVDTWHVEGNQQQSTP